MIYEPLEDSELLKKHIKAYALGKKVLDMGTGSGIQAEEAKRYTQDVLAVDINEEAVALVKKKGIDALHSDLFSAVKGTFDLILFNPPYLPREDQEDEETRLITTGGVVGSELLELFLKQAKRFLNKDGKILIVVSSLTGEVELLFRKYSYTYTKIDSENIFFEELIVYELS
ncbi:MAG: HemK2/MTQ2 family protein methyltransferase [Candidatus Nanoarchaeia archaeon]